MLQIIRKLVTFAGGTIDKSPFSVPHIMSEVKIVRKPRYDGRVKKREWEQRRTDKGEGLDEITKSKVIKRETPVTSELIEKIKRRKFAVLLGYSGTEYFGMQRNPNMKTIEEDLFNALLKNGYITEENFTQVQTMQFQRAARTDKGVSAARQVASMKLPENVDIAKINEHLPDVVRVFGVVRVTKGFNCKVQCDSRSYIYILPTVAFIPKEETMVQKGFRIQPKTLAQINQVLQKFVGTKNYHNFTSKKKHTDPSAKRFMKVLQHETPFVKDDVEFIVIRIQGQSFMLHQIRKMVGLLIAIIKGFTPEETLDMAFTDNRVNIPRVPGLGLVLDYVHYDRYDQRYGEDGVHEKLTWEDKAKEIEEFKHNFIYPTIVNTELAEEAMVKWIVLKLSGHTFDDTVDEEIDDEVKSDSEDKADEVETTEGNLAMS